MRKEEQPTVEPVAWRYRNVEWPERTPWQFCREKPGYDLPEVIEEPLYPASTIEALQAERDIYRQQVERVLDPGYLSEKIEQVGMVDAEWQDRATTAESEASALRKRVEELAAPFDRGDGLDGRISWEDLEREFSRRQDLAHALTEGGNNAG